ncbi:MAG: hypothetical protein Q9201_007000 [Fulgogasparrea decipioides]
MERSRPLNLTELDEKLRNIGPKSNRERCSLTRETYEEETRASQVYAEKNRQALIQAGGRPTRPIQYDPGHWVFVKGVDDCMSEEEDDEQRELRWVSDHFGKEGSRFAIELHAWQAFKRFQLYKRKKPSSLWKIQQQIDELWKERGVSEKLKPQLQIDPQKLSKVEEWKEFYWYKLQQLPEYEEDIEKEERLKEKRLQYFDTASSETLEEERLLGGWQNREHIIRVSDGEIRQARRDRDRHISQLEWIERQLPVIASECAGSDQVSKCNSSSTPKRQPDIESRLH